MWKKSKSFTLIEMLVVVFIIGILATLIIISVSSARAKGRDTKRVADLKSIQTALEMFYEVNGKYPTTDGATPDINPDQTGSYSTTWVDSKVALEWENGLGSQSFLGKYISPLPKEPTPGSITIVNGTAPTAPSTSPCTSPTTNTGNAYYLYRSNGSSYKLLARQEVSQIGLDDGDLTSGGSTTRCDWYAVWGGTNGQRYP